MKSVLRRYTVLIRGYNVSTPWCAATLYWLQGTLYLHPGLHTAAEQSITAVHLIYQTDDIYNTRRANSEQQLGIHGECKGPCTESISAVIKNCDDASDSVFIKNNGVASSKCGSRISVAGTATNTNVSKFPKIA